MGIVIITLLLLIAIFTAMPLYIVHVTKKITAWDMTYPFLGVAAWFFFCFIKMGSAVSLANTATELALIGLVSISVALLRLVIFRMQGNRASRLTGVLTVIPTLAAFALRQCMPTLPE